MAMFSSNPSNGQNQDSPAANGRQSGEAGLSIVASGTKVIGTIIGAGTVRVDGTVEGTVRSDGKVLIGRSGLVEGDIHTREAVVGGQVRGTVFAEDRVEVQAGSSVHGDINASKLAVEDGGGVNGHIRMGRPSEAERPEPNARPHHGDVVAAVSDVHVTKGSHAAA